MSSASGSRERELKLGVPDAASFEALVESAGGRRDSPALQVNHFFDTAERGLRALGVGFRVRKENGDFFLTLKGPTGGGERAVLSDRVELECTLPPELAGAVLAGERPARELLDELDAGGSDDGGLLEAVRGVCAEAPLTEIGSFENERLRVHTVLAGTEVVLEFDRTCFPGAEVQHEVELELGPEQSADELAAALGELFAANGVHPVATTSKLARFLAILDARDSGDGSSSAG